MTETEPEDALDPSNRVAEGSYLSEHPVAIGVLIVAMTVGASVSYVNLSETLSPIRSVLGGAVAGFGCWLLVMVGRVIGE